MTALQLVSVHKARGTGPELTRAVRGVSLEVARGEVVLLRGPSGSGKTTVLALAGGLLIADAGSVRCADVDPATQSIANLRQHRARNVGFVFQRAALLARLTVQQNIELMGNLAGMHGSRLRGQCSALLDQLGLSHLANRLPRQLSGGEEMRVAVARALVHSPSVVLADEPTANLDSAAGAAVADLLRDAARSLGAAVLVATHDARLGRVATRSLTISDGGIVPEGSVSS